MRRHCGAPGCVCGGCDAFRDAAGEGWRSRLAVKPPLVVHVVYRFDTGGLENGVVNLINRMPEQSYRHAVVALTEVVPGFARRIGRDDVPLVSLHKPPGHGVKLYPRLARLFREWQPAVVHTRNLAALEAQVPAWWAGVPVRVHGEHGRDAHDVDGTVKRYQWVRRAHAPFVHHWVALSQDLGTYLQQRVGIAASRVTTICNGVDHERFSPSVQRTAAPGSPFSDPAQLVVGTVGRMLTVKAQPLLARAFVLALQCRPQLRDRLRLVMVGDGPLRAECEQLLDAAGVRDRAWFSGDRSDVPALMRSFDLFVLPSLAEGISNTILEAMASGLPVVATRVGGNAELVSPGITGTLVPPGDVQALCDAILHWVDDGRARQDAGRAARAEVERRFSLDAMVAAYQGVYDRLRAGAGAR